MGAEETGIEEVPITALSDLSIIRVKDGEGDLLKVAVYPGSTEVVNVTFRDLLQLSPGDMKEVALELLVFLKLNYALSHPKLRYHPRRGILPTFSFEDEGGVHIVGDESDYLLSARVLDLYQKDGVLYVRASRVDNLFTKSSQVYYEGPLTGFVKE